MHLYCHTLCRLHPRYSRCCRLHLLRCSCKQQRPVSNLRTNLFTYPARAHGASSPQATEDMDACARSALAALRVQVWCTTLKVWWWTFDVGVTGITVCCMGCLVPTMRQSDAGVCILAARRFTCSSHVNHSFPSANAGPR